MHALILFIAAKVAVTIIIPLVCFVNTVVMKLVLWSVCVQVSVNNAVAQFTVMFLRPQGFLFTCPVAVSIIINSSVVAFDGMNTSVGLANTWSDEST